MSKGGNNMEFTAEVNRLLQILTHSIYSNKEVFFKRADIKRIRCM